MMLKKFLFALILTTSSLTGRAGEGTSPLWLRASAISPDGQTICFAYMGDLYTVPVTGGQARQLTSNPAWDGTPVWSPSGQHIAFTSEREGSLDIYLMTATGSQLTRLTTRSGSEMPLAFLSDDELLFTSVGLPTIDDMQFPSGIFPHLYKVRTKAGARPERVSDLSAGNLTVGPGGSFIYDAVKGYEDPMRKHQTSSIARDLWLCTPSAKRGGTPAYRQLTTSKTDDRSPVFVASQQTLYWLSEENGTFNVWSRTLDEGAQAKRLTNFKDMPVRYLTAAADGTLCFSWDGELYTLQTGGQPKKVKIEITSDVNERDVIRNIVSRGATSVSHSPKNKEIAFILGGDVYVTSYDYKTTKQVTDGAGRERTVSFSDDGRSLVYDSERNGRWCIYRSTIKQKDEKQFTYATELEEERLTPEDQTCFEPQYSPNGKLIAFLRDRQELCVMDTKSKSIHTVMPGKFQYSRK